MDERQLIIEILEPDKFIKVNELKEITNPIFFIRDGIPTSDGLLSNEIFGISKDERSNIFAYIDLHENFIHPLIYKQWCSMDKRVREIVHGTKKFIINSKGEFEENQDGDCGIKFLKNNIDKIKIKSTDSSKRDVKIKFFEENKNKIFIKQYIIIPAYYRDVNSDGGHVGVGEINKLYNSLIIAVRSLKETADYGISMSNSIRGRIQESILQIYDWFCKGTDESGSGLSKKEGIIKRSVMTKTADYASRLVISAPELKVEYVDDLMVDLDHSAVPLASLCSNLFPYMIFYIRRFFENEFAGNNEFKYIDKKGEIKYLTLKDPLEEFSDERIKKELERFMKAYSNRFIAIELPNKEGIPMYLRFKGRVGNENEMAPGDTPLLSRNLTWCDVIYQAAVECSKDKHALITRYPIDSFYGQFPTKIVVSSTKEIEPMWINNTFYKHYPKIRQEDIGQNTSNKFVDTLNICNAYLEAIGGDYDGDQCTVKVAYLMETNEELNKHMSRKIHYIDLGGNNVRRSSNEAIQSLYNMTLILPGTNITEPKF